jgi:hypothetical protein
VDWIQAAKFKHVLNLKTSCALGLQEAANSAGVSPIGEKPSVQAAA